jgi:hypothetical protein
MLVFFAASLVVVAFYSFWRGYSAGFGDSAHAECSEPSHTAF